MDLNEITFWDSNSVPKKLQELAQLFSPQSMVDTVWKIMETKNYFLRLFIDDKVQHSAWRQ